MDPDGSLSFYVVLVIILICINAFFSMSEIAIVTLNDNRVRKLAQEGNKKAALLIRLIDEPSRFLATIQVGVTLSGFLISAVAAAGFTGYLYTALGGPGLQSAVLRFISLIVVTVVFAFLTLVFGELVPKRIGLQHCEKVSMAVARPLTVISKLEKPFVFLLSSSTNGLLRLIGINPHQKPESVTEEEIRMMIDVGNESGYIEETEKVMLNNIFEFDDRTVDEVMTHRTEIEAVEYTATLQQVMDVAVNSGYSRIPVFEDDLDSIVGILYVKDLLGLVLTDPDAPFRLSDYIREALYVPDSAGCSKLLARFQAEKLHMAVVVDEYGGTSGLITMEDLLESIVGNIQDEYDDEDEDIVQVAETVWLIDGLADLDVVTNFFRLPVSEEVSDEFDTIGGFVVDRLGSIPDEGADASIEIGDLLLKVEEVDDRRILRLRAEKLPEPVHRDPIA